jgi:hypothetical protein
MISPSGFQALKGLSGLLPAFYSLFFNKSNNNEGNNGYYLEYCFLLQSRGTDIWNEEKP